MRTHFNPKNNPRVIIIQKLYGKFFNEDVDLEFPKHRFKKFIKDIGLGTIERNELILTELDSKFGNEFIFENFDKVFQVILKAATYEFLYKPNVSINIIIKEYLNSSNFFLDDSQTKYLNALLDNGTRCSILAFILSAGTVHKHASKSISSHCINLTSPERAAVRIKNSSIIAPRLGLLVAFSIVATKSGKSCHGIDG